MAAAELIVDVHHHYMPAVLFDRLAAQAGGRRIVTNEISLTLNPSRKDLEAHLKIMDDSGVTVSILTDQVQVMGAEVARALNDGIAEAETKAPDVVSVARFICRFMSPKRRSANSSAALTSWDYARWRCSPAISISSSTIRP